MARLTQGLAAAFMVFAVFLAYAGAHTGSSRLQEASKDDAPLLAADAPIDWERIGPNPLPLPDPAEAEAKRKAFEAKLGDVPQDEAAGSDAAAPAPDGATRANAGATVDASDDAATGDAPGDAATGGEGEKGVSPTEAGDAAPNAPEGAPDAPNGTGDAAGSSAG